eukprot:CAMPEP_0197559056 /NCGR_PEP_ID=MMETSP1320-20131121/20463_1 /TAXON_ID=91990 /ORGANISM="Bolidomonas sp., Strain RCC2347" /LENGTH=619 /DNA_ID=CAMNT_0043120437 /DNA_START=87 /DNA_END=1942 /DNA_ORIENTATION=+
MILTVILNDTPFLLPVNPLSPVQTLLPLALTTHTKTLGLPPPTPAVDFTWVLYLGKTVLPSAVEIGKVLKEGNEVRVEAVEVETRGGSNAVESMHDDVLAKIQILGNAIASSTSLVGAETLDLILTCGEAMDSLNVCKYAERTNDIALFSRCVDKLDSAPDVVKALDSLRKMKWSVEEIIPVIYKCVTLGGRPCEVMTSLLAVSTSPISSYEESKDEEVKESKFDDDEEGKEGEGGGGGRNSAAQPRHLPLSFFAKLINTPVASTKLPPYTNILLTSILLLQSLEHLKGTDPLAYISLRANLKDGKHDVLLALRAVCRRILKDRRDLYEKEMKVRFSNNAEAILTLFYDTMRGHNSVLPTDEWFSTDRLLLTYLKIVREVAGADEESCIACCRLCAMGEAKGDWQAIESAEELVFSRDERDWNVTERIRQCERIHILSAIRSVAGALLAESTNLKPSLQAANLLVKSLGTVGKAVGCNMLCDQSLTLSGAEVKELIKVSLYQGGAARTNALKCLATLSQNEDGRMVMLANNSIHCIATVLVSAVEGSVGEENFYLEREIASAYDSNASVDKFYANTVHVRRDIERYCARILVHLAMAGDRERNEIADEVESLELTDSVA